MLKFNCNMDEEVKTVGKTTMKVVKRDGRVAEFDEEKIKKAIRKAMMKTEGGVDEVVIMKIVDNFKNSKYTKDGSVEVDTIQDFIENELMKSKRKDVAKEYILYRAKRTREREKKSKLIKNIKKKLEAKNIENQNANVDEASFGGRIGEASRVVTKEFALNYCMSEKSRNNHLNNEIYIHDLDSYAVGCHNCLTVPFDDLLAKGFNTRQVDIRPANSINTAFQLIAVIFQIQSLQQFGGVASSHLDWTMVPYVRKSFYKHYKEGLEFILDYDEEQIDTFGINDTMSIEDEKYKSNEKIYNYALKLTVKELNQAAEGMYHNLNSLQSRSGKTKIAALI